MPRTEELPKCHMNIRKEPDISPIFPANCSKDQFFDLIQRECVDDVENAFLTDDVNGFPFCYVKKGLQHHVRATRSVRNPQSVDYNGRYLHDETLITEKDVRKLLGPEEDYGKFWEQVWWFEELDKLRGFYQFWLQNASDDPFSLFSATDQERNTFVAELRERVTAGRFTDVNVHVLGDDSDPDATMDNSTGIIMAAQSGLSEVIDIFEGMGGDVNATTRQAPGAAGENTALHMAVNVMMLADGFANEDAYDGTVNDMLLYNTQMGRVLDCVKRLIYHGANIDAQNSAGFTPIMIACGAQRYKIAPRALVELSEDWRSKALCELLLASTDLDVNVIDEFHGQTALHHACKHSDVSAVQALLKQRGIDKNVQDAWGMTPLHCVCDVKGWLHDTAQRGDNYAELTQLLIDNGADLLLLDYRNRTARDMLHEQESTSGFNIDIDTVSIRFGSYYYDDEFLEKIQTVIVERREELLTIFDKFDADQVLLR